MAREPAPQERYSVKELKWPKRAASPGVRAYVVLHRHPPGIRSKIQDSLWGSGLKRFGARTTLHTSTIFSARRQGSAVPRNGTTENFAPPITWGLRKSASEP